jgi:membrane associated rhomboid family serine protease
MTTPPGGGPYQPLGPAAGSEPEPEPVCPRHPDRVAYVRCQRCNRPTCPECQRPAAVGIQCVDCVKEQAKTLRPTRAVFGGRGVQGRPVVTQAIIAICVLVWLGELVSPTFADDVAFAPSIGESEPWRFLTSAFAHYSSLPYGLFHIGFNMYALLIVGSYLEPLVGRAKYAAMYLISALGGSVMFLLIASPPSPAQVAVGDGGLWYTGLVGASGAVFGLFGALLVLNRRLGRSSAGMYGVLVINAVLGFSIPGIAWQAHVGGFIVGAACAAAIAYAGRPPKPNLQWAGLAGMTLLLVAATVVKYSIAG